MIKKKAMNRANNSKFLIFIFDLKNAYQLIKNKKYIFTCNMKITCYDLSS